MTSKKKQKQTGPLELAVSLSCLLLIDVSSGVPDLRSVTSRRMRMCVLTRACRSEERSCSAALDSSADCRFAVQCSAGIGAVWWYCIGEVVECGGGRLDAAAASRREVDDGGGGGSSSGGWSMMDGGGVGGWRLAAVKTESETDNSTRNLNLTCSSLSLNNEHVIRNNQSEVHVKQ